MGYLYYSNVKIHLEHNTEILKVISLTAYHKNDIEHDKDSANPRLTPDIQYIKNIAKTVSDMTFGTPTMCSKCFFLPNDTNVSCLPPFCWSQIMDYS